MAITFVASSESAPISTEVTSFSLTVPSHNADDMGIILFYVDEDTVTPDVDEDWIQLVGSNRSSGRDQNVSVWYKVLSGSETNPTLTITTGVEFMIGSIHVFRGVDPNFEPGMPEVVNSQTNYAGTDSPVPANVSSTFDNACKIQMQAASHDDWDSISTPTGYTDGENYPANQGTTDHQQHCTAYDLNIGVAGSYAWVNFDNPNTGTGSEITCIHFILEELQPIHVLDVDTDEAISTTQEDVTITGDGFEASQVGGIVELVENADYTGTKVTQTIVPGQWSDTSIDFDVVQGGLLEGLVYLFVTNDSGDLSYRMPISLGFGAYDPLTMGDYPDVFWTLDNTYADTGLSAGTSNADGNNQSTPPPDFEATPICRTAAQSLRLDSRIDLTEPSDSVWMNITNQHTRRRLGGWINLRSAQLLPGVVFEEGGGVNNIYFVTGYGSQLFANIEDDADFSVQAFADFPLTLGRPYHIMCAFDGSGDGNEFYLLIDGVKQALTSGNPIDKTNQVTHGGNPSFGAPLNDLQTGGQDIAYVACDDVLCSMWGSWSALGGGIPTDTEILELLFENGALADDILTAAAESAMQTAIEAFDSAARDDWPLSYEIPPPSTGGPDLELTITDQVFDSRISLHIRWLSSGVLTIRNSGTSNFDGDKVHLPGSGTVVVIETATITVHCQDISTGADLENARVLLLADSGGPLPADDTVTITRVSSTATVAHTAHGLLTGAQVAITFANQLDYNGIRTITVTGVNEYTYTVSGTPTTPATGTIKCSAIVLTGLTDVSGDLVGEIDFTTSQPVTGRSRRGTTTPLYKTAQIAGTVEAAGLSVNVPMVSDE